MEIGFLMLQVPLGFDLMDHETPMEDLGALRSLVLDLRDQERNSLRVIEIGSWAGLSTLALLDAARIFCIDTWEGNPSDRCGLVAKKIGAKRAYQTFCKNMGRYLFKSVFPLPGHSLTYADVWPFPVELIFIDADHDQCAQDIMAWLPHVIKGGIMAVHDYGIFPAVTEAVDSLLPGHETSGRTIAWKRL